MLQKISIKQNISISKLYSLKNINHFKSQNICNLEKLKDSNDNLRENIKKHEELKEKIVKKVVFRNNPILEMINKQNTVNPQKRKKKPKNLTVYQGQYIIPKVNSKLNLDIDNKSNNPILEMINKQNTVNPQKRKKKPKNLTVYQGQYLIPKVNSKLNLDIDNKSKDQNFYNFSTKKLPKIENNTILLSSSFSKQIKNEINENPHNSNSIFQNITNSTNLKAAKETIEKTDQIKKKRRTIFFSPENDLKKKKNDQILKNKNQKKSLIKKRFTLKKIYSKRFSKVGPNYFSKKKKI